MLGKSLHRYNWLALILLTAGVALVQYPSGDSPAKTSSVHDASDNILGLGAVLAACFSSGFAGVYFEKILKTSKVSLWIRNIQLAFFSVFGSLFVCWLYDWQAISDDGFLRGYNKIIWIVVLLQVKSLKNLKILSQKPEILSPKSEILSLKSHFSTEILIFG